MNHASSQQQKILDSALSFAVRGLSVIPLKGKIPLIKDWPRTATTDGGQILKWQAAYPDCNYGMVTGKRSGILVLDVDLKNDGPGQLETLEALYGELPLQQLKRAVVESNIILSTQRAET